MESLLIGMRAVVCSLAKRLRQASTQTPKGHLKVGDLLVETTNVFVYFIMCAT